MVGRLEFIVSHHQLKHLCEFGQAVKKKEEIYVDLSLS
jgi:hypothetical protein